MNAAVGLRGWTFPRVHDLYVSRVVLVTVLLTWAVLLGLDLVLALFGEMGDIGKGNYGFPQAIAYVAYTAPRRAYTLFPTSAVIGALMGLGQLAATSELTALRALGLSRRRLSIAAAVALALLTAVMVFSGETVGPWGNRQADSLKASSISNELIVEQHSGLWAREGDVFLNAHTGVERAEDGERWLELRDVRLYEFDDAGRLLSIARAASAQHRDNGWLLHDVVRTRFGNESRIVALGMRLLPFRSPEKGAETLVWLACQDPSRLTDGGYYADRKPHRPRPKAADPALAARLWTASAEAVGLDA